MAPPIEAFYPSDLPQRVQYGPDGRKKKANVNLDQCALMEMVQYMCQPRDLGHPQSTIVCVPIVRSFRRCAGGLTVETTSWEQQTRGQ